MDHLQQLRTAFEKAEAKEKRLAAQLEGAQRERQELETAIRVLERLTEPKVPSTAAASQSDNGQLIYGYVGIGRQNACAPKEIIEAMRADGHDLGDDLIRTQLWRMAKRNELQKSEGRYWRPVIRKDESESDGREWGRDDSPVMTKDQNDWGNWSAPPVDRGFGSADGFADDLDDDIPF
jgi:hypothetical protein